MINHIDKKAPPQTHLLQWRFSPEFHIPHPMAPTLTSNSFLLNTTPRSRLVFPKNPRQQLAVYAKKSGSFPSFGRRKQQDEDSGEEGESPNPFRLSFDFGKVSDVKSLIPVGNKPLASTFSRRKDANTVFVAGATGQAGIRIAQTLLREGFSVRAGVPELGAAQDLARLAVNYKIISPEESKRLNAVESTYVDVESIAKAIGNASKAVVTIAPSENGPTAEVTTLDALQIVQAAQLAGVSHVAIIYDGSTGISSSGNVLDGIQSFFSNLFSKKQPLTIKEFLDSLIETDVKYTLIKTSLTEDYSPESSYNVVVSAEGSSGANDYKVAKSQIASLVADVFSNTEVAENKVVEVSTDPTAPARPVNELFSLIPEDGRRKAYQEAIAKAKAEEEAIKAAEKAREAAEAAKKLEEEVKKLEQQEAMAASLAQEAQQKATAAGTTFTNLFGGSKTVDKPGEKPEEESPQAAGGLSWEKLSSQFTSAIKNPIEIPKVQVATVRGQAKARNLPAQKAVVKTPSPKAVSKAKEAPKTAPKQTESKPEVKKLFGGIFQQETIYVDD